MKNTLHELFEICREQEQQIQALRDNIHDALTLIKERLFEISEVELNDLSKKTMPEPSDSDRFL